ncbi:hypothetical protein GBA65_15045 [Rubrobacter marinus]|uniref:Uncharacterized protein n=1 Tax=Rubrobacter marinus TaxID=2653852 RepID=A0A6G8PZI0_9ACTN|nr:hypothetical protein [Rubrobacter marinus]QIN79621.1 hypothetical protein GBA65_15045 [Rubrobacter marinus]
MIRKMDKRGWYWTPYTERFDHGGWVFFDWREPWATARWLFRFWRGAPGASWYNPSRRRHGPIRYVLFCAWDAAARTGRQTRKDYRLWRMVYGPRRAAYKILPEIGVLARLESRMFWRRVRRGSWWG